MKYLVGKLRAKLAKFFLLGIIFFGIFKKNGGGRGMSHHIPPPPPLLPILKRNLVYLTEKEMCLKLIALVHK